MFTDLPDRLGNRATIKIVSTLNLAAKVVVLLVPSYVVRMLCFFVMGLCFLRYTTAYAWLSGFVMKKHLGLVTAVMTSYDQLVVAIMVAYFLTVSRKVAGILIIQTGLSALALLYALLTCPESPKWFLAKGRKHEAIRVLN